MKSAVKIIAMMLALSCVLCLASCGSKKDKMRQSATTAETSAVPTTTDSGFITRDYSYLMTTTVATATLPTRAAQKKTVIKINEYELYDYKNLSFAAVIDTQQFYCKNHYIDFHDFKEYCAGVYSKKHKDGDTMIFQRRLKSNGGSDYVDGKGNKIGDKTAKRFFADNPNILDARYYEVGGVEYMNFRFILPRFVGTLDYSMDMVFAFHGTGDSLGLDELDDVDEFKEISSCWYYYIKKDYSTVYRINN